MNCEEFPVLAQGRVHISDDETFGTISTEGSVVDSRTVSSVWYRRVAVPPVPKMLSDKDREFVRGECRAFLNGFFDLLNCSWTNERGAEQRACNKLLQLSLARKCGLRAPRTLITNDSTRVRDFVSSTSGQVLFKPVSGFAPQGANYIRELSAYSAHRLKYELFDDGNDEQLEVVFSQILTEEKMTHLESLDYCPVIFQEYVPKLVEIRVTVVGQEVFACEIHSQAAPETSVDFRRIAVTDSLHRVPHLIHALKPHITEKLLIMMELLGISFGCFDLILTPEGEYVFLEVNPSGQWLWIERLTGLRISECLASFLASRRLAI